MEHLLYLSQVSIKWKLSQVKAAVSFPCSIP